MKKIGIGYENFKDFTKEKMYYVDKTMLIKDVVEKGGKTTLFTRPRRFGKTLALSMLRTFFELEYDENGKAVDNRRYFEGMKIMDAGDDVLGMMGQYPVINLSLKSAKQPDFFNAFIKLRDDVYGEILRHYYLKDSVRLNAEDKAMYAELRTRTSLEKLTDADTFRMEVVRYSTALKTLSGLLKKHHGRNVIILIDEYDVPLENAWFCGFYDEMVGFVRSLFESALKTNDALERAVVTGCLRISRESIFTGLNNLKVNSILDTDFGEYFGFTQAETDQILAEYGLAGNGGIVRQWYDGYLFGRTEVYNPWSVISYVDDHVSDHERFAKPYWANTSSNSIIKELIENADDDMRRELDELIGGGTIEKQIHEDITYGDVHDSEDNLWNFLFFTGYMKKVSERQDGNKIYLTMRIPNMEVGYVYENQISNWFNKVVKSDVRAASWSRIPDSARPDHLSGLCIFLCKDLRAFVSTGIGKIPYLNAMFSCLIYDAVVLCM